MAQEQYKPASSQDKKTTSLRDSSELDSKDIGAEFFMTIGSKRFDCTLVDYSGDVAKVRMPNGQERLMPVNRLKKEQKL